MSIPTPQDVQAKLDAAVSSINLALTDIAAARAEVGGLATTQLKAAFKETSVSFTVNFTDHSSPGPSGPITAWHWDFGDGGTSTSQNPSHAYSAAGTYSVVLIVTGTSPDGTNTVTTSVTVVNPVTLTAAFTETDTGLIATLTEASIAGPSGPITGWAWNFGDGNTSSVQHPSPHTYASGGNYNVQLTVTGTSPDGTSSVTHPITVGTSSILQQFLDTVMADSNMVRPTTKPASSSSHYKPFTTITQMQSLLVTAVPGDYIFYNGSSPLIVSSSTKTPYILNGHNYSGLVTLDFGTSKSQYDPSKESSAYVKFAYTGTGQFDGAAVENCSNLAVYGGEMTTGNYGGGGLRFFGLTHDCYFLDFYVNLTGGSGVMIQPITVGGSASQIYNTRIRGESNRPCMNPAHDNHPDRGTGWHGCLVHGNAGAWHNSTVAILAHDPLQPGESSAGNIWPEGAGGSACEIGTNGAATNAEKTNRYYVYGENFKMVCNGTNPGSTARQTGGNGINWWGSVPLDGNTVGFVGLVNSTGQASHGAGGSWQNGSPAIIVEKGRHSNTNQAYPLNNLSSATDSYDRRHGITYTNCT